MQNTHRHATREAIMDAAIPVIRAAVYAAVIGFAAVVGMYWGSQVVKGSDRPDKRVVISFPAEGVKR